MSSASESSPCSARLVLGRRQSSATASSSIIHAIVDGKGRPLYITLTAGRRHEMTAADDLLKHACGKALIGDTGYDSTEFRQKVRARGMKPVICCHPNRKRGRTRLDRKLYRARYKVECSFHSLKRFGAVA